MQFFSESSIQQIRSGYFSAVYFTRTRKILLSENILTPVIMQVFQRKEGSVLCGVSEVLELLYNAVGYYKENRWIDKRKEIRMEFVSDGTRLKSGEPVMYIRGPYAYFAHLESLYLGIFARRTLIATQTRNAVEAAGGKPFDSAQGKPVYFFADRFDYFQNQEGDGYAARVGGATGVCTAAQAVYFGSDPVGTIPHALIAVCGGDTVKAAQLFSKHFPDVRLIVLVDFDNDCVDTALKVAKALGKKLWGIRVDTASDLVDKSLETSAFAEQNSKHNNKLRGVNPMLVKLVRNALDDNGYSWVKIIVSGGFDAEKIKRFEEEKTPVDGYGVGSALIHGENDFTADIVQVNDKKVAKVGRSLRQIAKSSSKIESF